MAPPFRSRPRPGSRLTTSPHRAESSLDRLERHLLDRAMADRAIVRLELPPPRYQLTDAGLRVLRSYPIKLREQSSERWVNRLHARSYAAERKLGPLLAYPYLQVGCLHADDIGAGQAFVTGVGGVVMRNRRDAARNRRRKRGTFIQSVRVGVGKRSSCLKSTTT